MGTTKQFRAPTAEGVAIPELLIVEDDEQLAKILVRTLNGDGYKVTHVSDGVQATEALTSRSFDVVLSDISLPKISGIDLLRLVRAYDLDVPVILMTGNPNLETAAQAIELGALQYLTKPFAMENLRTALTRAVALSRLARAKREALSSTAEGSVRIGDRAGLMVSFERMLETMKLAFQPIVDTRLRKIIAYEALLRSSEPSLPNPGAVLDAAERLNAIHQLGRRVRELAAAAIAKMPTPDALLFVNLHATELTDPELYGDHEPLAQHAHRVVLEITERASIESVQDLSRRAKGLRDIGFRIAVDDLGAGYAGLTTFATLEPEIVKLDLSLVQNIGQSVTKQRVVRSIVSLCREMSMRVVAEGVETREELACVSELGCDLLQGYYLGRPIHEFATTVPF